MSNTLSSTCWRLDRIYAYVWDVNTPIRGGATFCIWWNDRYEPLCDVTGPLCSSRPPPLTISSVGGVASPDLEFGNMYEGDDAVGVTEEFYTRSIVNFAPFQPTQDAQANFS